MLTPSTVCFGFAGISGYFIELMPLQMCYIAFIVVFALTIHYSELLRMFLKGAGNNVQDVFMPARVEC